MKFIFLDFLRVIVCEMVFCFIGVEIDMGIDFLFCIEYYIRDGIRGVFF